MDHSRNSILNITLMTFCLSFLGCGDADSDQPELGLVNGIVSLDGEPLDGASVTFLPDSGRQATATTDADGNYELIYIRTTKGCKLGHNKVVISTLTEPEDAAEEGDDAKIEIKRVVEKVPRKYNTRTELEADVKPGENKFDFKLTGF